MGRAGLTKFRGQEVPRAASEGIVVDIDIFVGMTASEWSVQKIELVVGGVSLYSHELGNYCLLVHGEELVKIIH